MNLINKKLALILSIAAVVVAGVALILALILSAFNYEKSPDAFIGSYQPSGGSVYKLQNSITTTQTTINLSSFKEPISNIKYTMPVLGSTYAYGTLEPKNPNKSEFIKFTGITQNADGTATLTGVTRGLPRSNTVTGGCTASTTLALSHGGQSDFILSNSPCEASEYALKNFDDTISGYWTVPTPLSNSNPATKAYVDSLVNGGAVSNARVTVAGTAGETVATGTVVYLKQADARWYKAGVGTSEASTTPIGISQGNGTSGNAIQDGVLLYGLDEGQSGLTSGMNYFIGPTAGTLSTATSTRVVGRARSATTIYVYPDFPVGNDTWVSKAHYASTTQAGNFNITTASTTFTNITTSSVDIVGTSSLKVGAFPAWHIGKQVQLFYRPGASQFQVPQGITKVWVRMVGGGGGGGGSNASAASACGGGAAYIEGGIDVSATTSVQVTVGDGGNGGTNAPTAGTAGSDSLFGNFLTAKGGSGGGTNAAATPGAGGATTTESVINIPGGQGAIWTDDSLRCGGPTFLGGPNAFGTGGNGRGNSGSGEKGIQGFVIVSW